jgi:hypothetical protein
VARSPIDLEIAFSDMAKDRVDAVVMQEDAVFVSNVRAIVDLVASSGSPRPDSLSLPKLAA